MQVPIEQVGGVGLALVFELLLEKKGHAWAWGTVRHLVAVG